MHRVVPHCECFQFGIAVELPRQPPFPGLWPAISRSSHKGAGSGPSPVNAMETALLRVQINTS